MKTVVTTLSLGVNYTKDYTLRMAEDILKLSDMDFYITTDCPEVIYEVYPDNPRLHINVFDRKQYRVRLFVGPNEYTSDFNFNIRYLCLEPVMDLEDTVVIFTDCDNSFDWYDKNEIDNYINHNYVEQGFDFFGPRTDYRWGGFLNDYHTHNNKTHGLFWHKIYNYDLTESLGYVDEWNDAPLPAEYLLIFVNDKTKKLKKMFEQWKWFHDYLAKRDYTEGTWAEGFEIGVSAHVAGFKALDIGWNHGLWSRMFEANGYKTGKRAGAFHGTDFD